MFRLLFILFVSCTLTSCIQKKKEPFASKWLVAPLEEKEDASLSSEFKEVLEQPFFFLGQGAQCYAFLGEDGKTVLKLFKKDRKRFFWKKEKQGFKEASDAYKLAFKQLKEETGLLYLHLNESALNGKLTLIDEQKKVHRIYADETAFLLQKRVELLPDYLDSLAGDRVAIEEVIQKFETFFIHRTKKGITDPKQALRINYGFLDGQVVQLDPGKIYEDAALKENSEAEIKRLIDHLHVWMDRKYNPTCPLSLPES